MTPTFIKSFAALAVIAGNLIVKAGTNGVSVASAATDPLIGVADSMGAAAGAMLDVPQAGWHEVRCGGVVTNGDPLTSDATGRAIKAVPTANAITRIVGFAMSDGNDGDIIPYLIAPGVIAKSA